MGEDNEQVGLITRGQLLKDISELLDNKLSTLATREDLVSVSERVSGLEKENAILKSEVSSLQSREAEVAAKLLDLEGRSRRNNLIFRGLKVESDTKDFVRLVQRFCSEKFGCASTMWVNRAHPLGRDRKAVIAHLPADSDIDYIMARVGDLKGTGCSVQRDYPQEIRRRRACLSAVREEVERVAGNRYMPLAFDYLSINGHRFKWENGRLKTLPDGDGAEMLKSLFKHDFSEFLATLEKNSPLASRGLGGRRVSPTAAQVSEVAGAMTGDKTYAAAAAPTSSIPGTG